MTLIVVSLLTIPVHPTNVVSRFTSYSKISTGMQRQRDNASLSALICILSSSFRIYCAIHIMFRLTIRSIHQSHL